MLYENASLHHCKEKEGVSGSRQKAYWPLSIITISNTRSPVVFLFLEKSFLHKKPTVLLDKNTNPTCCC